MSSSPDRRTRARCLGSRPVTVLEPDDFPASATLILLHGMGTTATDFSPMARRIQRGMRFPLRVLLPEAEPAPVTLLAGRATHRWFDLRDADFRLREDRAGITQACTRLRDLIEQEVLVGIPLNRIALAGFSQGGALAIAAAALLPPGLGGLASLSGWTPLKSEVAAAAAYRDGRTPIFIGHGAEDPVVPLAWAEETRTWLERAGHPVTWRTYPIGHGVSGAESDDLAVWLEGVLDGSRAAAGASL